MSLIANISKVSKSNVKIISTSFRMLFYSISIFPISEKKYQHYPIYLFANPSAQAGYDTRSIYFKRSLTGFNSEFSFS